VGKKRKKDRRKMGTINVPKIVWEGGTRDQRKGEEKEDSKLIFIVADRGETTHVNGTRGGKEINFVKPRDGSKCGERWWNLYFMQPSCPTKQERTAQAWKRSYRRNFTKTPPERKRKNSERKSQSQGQMSHRSEGGGRRLGRRDK